ncbi:hypothetical protein HWV62_29999 [Athelia sp. TMB]|nr:hypothetical protein HWV62_29999 [Athelia sp. TMB]
MIINCPSGASPAAFFDQVEHSHISLYSSGSSFSGSKSSLDSSDKTADEYHSEEAVEDGENYTPIQRTPFITSPMRAHFGDSKANMVATKPQPRSFTQSFLIFKTKDGAPPSPPKLPIIKAKQTSGAGKRACRFRRKSAPGIRIPVPIPITLPMPTVATPGPRAVVRPRTKSSTWTDITTTTATTTTDTSVISNTTASTSVASSSVPFPVSGFPRPRFPPRATLSTSHSASTNPVRNVLVTPEDHDNGRVSEWVNSQLSLSLSSTPEAGDSESGAGPDGVAVKWKGGEGVREVPVLMGMLLHHMEDEKVRLRKISRRGKVA